MKRDKSDEKKYRHEGLWVGIVAALCLVLIVVVASDSLQKTKLVVSLETVSIQSRQLVLTLDNLLLEITDAQNSERGYILNNNKDDLRAYKDAAHKIRSDSQDLIFLVDADQRPVAEKLQKNLEDKLAEFDRAVSSDQPNVSGQAISIADIRGEIAAMHEEAEANFDLQEQGMIGSEYKARERLLISVLVTGVCVLTSLVGIMYAIRQRRRLTKSLAIERSNAIEANRSKSNFLAYTSHELRTPLNAIIGFSEFLMMNYAGPITEKQKEYVKDIYNSGVHLQELITDILDLTKAEAGKITLVEKTIDLPTMVNACLKLMEGQAREAKIHLHALVDPTLPQMTGDELRCKQVVINLAMNAIKFTPADGEVAIDVSLTPAGEICLMVKDTGRGIPPEDIQKVFEPYYRSGIKEPSHKGYGLGLALVVKIVELHGGKLSLTSEVGKGTQVSVIFPSSRNVPKPVIQMTEMPVVSLAYPQPKYVAGAL